jgi:hypothetical protein
MQITRDKRVLNLGVQPVIKNVEASVDTRDMLGADPKIRGHMINLKKILQPFLNDKLKALGLRLQATNIMIVYGGIDAANYHFANKPMHIPFVEFVLCRIDCSKSADLEKARDEIVVTALLGEMNDILSSLAEDTTCTVTREILRECKTNPKKYFEAQRISAERLSIDFCYGSEQNGNRSTNQKESAQPFIEIRIMPELRISVLEKYGIFFMPLGFVLADVRTGMARYGGADWNFRESTLKQCLERSGLTLSFWTFVGLVRRCFPMLAMRKMGVVESVTALIAETCRNAPSHNGGAVGQLEIKLLAELKDWQNDKLLASILSFNELYSRCTLLGLMPEDNELKNNLNNTYNNTHVREARIGSLSQK